MIRRLCFHCNKIVPRFWHNARLTDQAYIQKGYCNQRCFALKNIKPNLLHEDDKDAYLPTPEEIAAACEEIQKAWEPHRFERKYFEFPTLKSPSNGGRKLGR